MSDKRTGGCLCGAVRYEVAGEPGAVMACHCKDCQRQGGSALSTIAAFPKEAVTLTNGALKTFIGKGESGGEVHRKFCGDCGSPIMSEIPGDTFGAMRFVKTGTLDDTSGLNPGAHIWTKSAQDWFVFPEGVAQVPAQ